MSPMFPVLTTVALCAAGLAAPAPVLVDVRICASLEEALGPGASGPVLLVFFALECPVCYEDLFESRYLLDEGDWPFPVIGVALALRDDLEAFLQKFAWTAPVVLDRRKTLFKRFKVDAVPYKVLIAGRETIYRDGAYLSLEARRAELKRCLTRLFSR